MATTPRTKRNRSVSTRHINPAEPPKHQTLLGGTDYTHAEYTDVRSTFIRMGWIPPSQLHTVKKPPQPVDE